jgi:hypothetical protein
MLPSSNLSMVDSLPFSSGLQSSQQTFDHLQKKSRTKRYSLSGETVSVEEKRFYDLERDDETEAAAGKRKFMLDKKNSIYLSNFETVHIFHGRAASMRGEGKITAVVSATFRRATAGGN